MEKVTIHGSTPALHQRKTRVGFDEIRLQRSRKKCGLTAATLLPTKMQTKKEK